MSLSDTDTNLKIFPSLRLRWKVDALRKSENNIYSSCFSFQGQQCCLSYHFYNNEHLLRFKNMDNYECLEPFDSVVNLERGCTLQEVPGLEDRDHWENDESSLIWGRTEAQIVKAYPEFCQDHHQLRFHIFLTAERPLVKGNSMATQTEVGQVCSVPCLEILSEDFAQLMDQGLHPDMEFQCAGQSYKAHKCIVCSRSPVIASMMASKMVEGITSVVAIPNMEPEVFKKFLRYLYSGKVEELSFETALDLYAVGEQYSVRGLASLCLQYLMENLSVDNACEVLVAVDAHGDSKSVENVMEYIFENKIPAMNDRWSAFCKDHTELALKVMRHFYTLSVK